VITGLVVGKIVGIGGMTYLARRLGWGTLPADMHHREILGTAALGASPTLLELPTRWRRVDGCRTTG
jgi:Na+/H+ antiporter NhaA